MSVAKIFDESFYLSNNADVVVAISQGHFVSGLQHYELFGGKQDLRDPNASFDASYYAAQNPDVLSAVSSGSIANVFAHYQTHGEAENRAPTAAFEGFDSAAYLEANADVQAAVTAGSFASALDHYIAFGLSEGRDGANVTGPKEDVPVSDGETFNLTDELETLNGTTGNDMFRGTGNTASAGDLIDGKDGNDTFMAFSTGTIPQMVSIENLVVDNLNGNLSTTGRTSLENVTLQNSTFTANRTVTLANGEALTLFNHEGAVNVDLSTTKASATITLNDVGNVADADVQIDLGPSATDVTELTLNGTGASSDVDLIDADNELETLKITGDQNIDVENAAITSLKIYDASAATTGQTFTVAAAAAASDLTITGSAGDDSFDLGNTLTKADAIDGGEGNDTVRIASTVAIAGDLQISNVETLRVDDSDTTVTIDLDNVAGLTTLRVSEGDETGQTITFKDVATTATTIQFIGDGEDAGQTFDGILVDYDGSDVNAKVEISNEVEAQNVAIRGIRVDNAESISINASNVGTGATEGLATGTITGSTLEKVSITSNGEINTTIVGTGELDDVDLSGSDAGIDLDLDIIEADGTVTLGDGTNEIDIQNTGTTAFELILGDGVDTIELSGAATNGGVTIEGFNTGTGGDVIDLTTNGALDGDDNTTLTAFEVFADMATWAANTAANADKENDRGFVVIGENIGGGTAGQLVALAGNNLVIADTRENAGAGNANDVIYIAVDDGADTYLFHFDGGNVNGTIDVADQVTLLATLGGVGNATTLNASNFSDFV